MSHRTSVHVGPTGAAPFAGCGTPTSHEERVAEQVARRIGYRGDDQPYYDDTEAKKIESRGVEAVVNAIALTGLDDDAMPSERQPLVAAAMARMWDVQRSDGAWDWLDFGLEPYEAPDAVFQGATMAAIAAGSPAGRQAGYSEAARAGIARLSRLPAIAVDRAACIQPRVDAAGRGSPRRPPHGAGARRDHDLTSRRSSAPMADGHSPISACWRWTRQEAPFAPPGTIDRALIAQSDGYATGLVVYALRRSGRPVSSPAVRRGQQWLIEHQVPERVGDPAWAPWRAYSLNYDREHGGPKGEPWRRMFMSDLATAFGVLALL